MSRVDNKASKNLAKNKQFRVMLFTLGCVMCLIEMELDTGAEVNK